MLLDLRFEEPSVSYLSRIETLGLKGCLKERYELIALAKAQLDEFIF